jgi:hypothetical protein
VKVTELSTAGSWELRMCREPVIHQTRSLAWTPDQTEADVVPTGGAVSARQLSCCLYWKEHCETKGQVSVAEAGGRQEDLA